MAGFNDLVGRNAPALGVNRAAYVAGDTWGDLIGPFQDNAMANINLAAVNIVLNIFDKPGGSSLLAINGTGYSNGYFGFTIPAANTAALASGAQRNLVWNCVMSSGGSVVSVWSAIESPLTVLVD